MMLRVVSQMSEAVNAALRAHPAVGSVREADPDTPWAAPEADVLVIGPAPVWRNDPPRPEGWPWHLRLVQSASAGVDWYPSWLFDLVPVACGRGTMTQPIAEYVLAAILGHAKRLAEIRVRAPEDWRRHVLAPVAGSTVGLLGFGSIGARVAALAGAFGAEIVAFRRSGAPIPGVALVESPAALAALSDHLVIAAPATAETRGIVSAEVLAAAKPGLHLINVARGSLIDDAALREALDGDRVAAATLDVTEPEPPPPGHWLYAHPRVWLTPHISWSHPRMGERLSEKVMENLARLAAGLPLADVVEPGRGY